MTAVAGLAKFYECSPDCLSPEQIRTSLHHLLVERRLAWRACHHAAAGLQFLYTKTLGWDVLHRHRPPRTGRSQLPQILRIEWAVNPRWSAVAQRDVNGIFDLDFFYKKRFK